jgi:hypothetical protein
LSIIIFIISSSLISLFYYTKLFYNLSVGSRSRIKINIFNENSTSNYIIVVSSTGNLIISIIVLLI